MEVRVDIAIIGAGPGGSVLAALLASRGATVALIDRDEFPRDKVCGEFLSYDAMPVLEILGADREIDRAGASTIRSCRVISRSRALEFDLPHPARGISRLALDELLFRNAAGHGARAFEGWTAEAVDGTSVRIRKIDEERRIVATVVAGAWGRWGRFDTQLGRTFVKDRSHRNFGFKRHYRGAVGAGTTTIDLYSFRRGYLGINEVEGGITNICGLVHASRLSGHRGGWDAFVDSLRAEEPRLAELYARFRPEQETFLTSEPVIFRARSAVERGLFMIGDASGVIDPLTGNGMAMAIESALIAAPRLLALVRGSADRKAIERDYAEAHRALFGPRIRWSRAIAGILSRPGLLDAAFRGATSRWLGRLLVEKTRGSLDEITRLADSWRRSS